MIVEKLYSGRLIKRYKRFLADVELESGEVIIVHCPNPGSMLGCSTPGLPVYLTLSTNPKRKLAYTLAIVVVDGFSVVVDTSWANKLVREAIDKKLIPELAMYDALSTEPRYMDSRFDLRLSTPGQKGECFVEIKSTTLLEQTVAKFPDAKTERGRRHLNRLVTALGEGYRAVQFYLIARADARSFTAANHIDPLYATALADSVAQGVEVIAWDLDVQMGNEGRAEVTLRAAVPVVI